MVILTQQTTNRAFGPYFFDFYNINTKLNLRNYMNKLTTIQWGPEGDQEPTLNDERNAKLNEMLLAGKTTTLTPVSYDDVTFTCAREWTSQEAAREYIDFIINVAPKYNKTIVSATITDA